MITPQWTADYPGQAGNYWFYGRRSRAYRGIPPRLMLVRAVLNGQGELVIASDAEFIYKSEWEGLWTRAELPEMPTALLDATYPAEAEQSA